MKVLNLYAGIGGNRKKWENVDVTAVEHNQEIAQVYSDTFPKDKVVVDDAHSYLKNNYEKFDFIWSSPPCPSHSDVRRMGVDIGQNEPVYPDMKLWQEILFLKEYYEGDWVIENVKPWYDNDIKWELVKPQEVQRHYFWSNFYIPDVNLNKDNIKKGKISEWEDRFGFDLSSYSFESVMKRKVLRNCIHPKLGKAVLDSVRRGDRQQTVEDVLQNSGDGGGSE